MSLSSHGSSCALASIATDDEDIEAQAARSRQLGKVKRFVYEDGSHGETVLAKLDTMRRGGYLCDVMVEIDGHSVAAHSAVLSSVSVYLFELFSGARMGDDVVGGARAGQAGGAGARRHFKLDGLIDYKSFDILVNYAYTSRLECEADQVSDVYKAAQFLKVNKVIEECANFLADNLTPRNCIGICRTVGLNDLDLRFRIHAYIQSNLEEVIEESQELRSLPSVLIDIIGVEPQGLYSGGEKWLCKLVVDWLETALDEHSLDQMTEDAHILYLNADNTLRDCLEDVDDVIIKNSDVVTDYKKLAKRKQMMHKSSCKEKVACYKARRSPTPGSLNGSMYALNSHSSTESLLSLAGADSVVIAVKTVGAKSFLCIASVADHVVRISIKFRTPPPVSDNSSPHAVTSNGVTNGVKHNSDVSVTDGVTASKMFFLPSAEKRMSPSADKQCSLEPLAAMSSPRCGLGTAVVNGQLVALGGYDRGECYSTVESYSLETNTWTVLKSMAKARGRFSVAQLNSLLYACGGSNGQADLSSVECYDPSVGSWVAVADMHCRRSSAGVGVCGGRLYVVGGSSGMGGRTTCEVFDQPNNHWNLIAELNIGRSQVALCEVEEGEGSWLMAAGGCDAWNCTNTVERYDPDTDCWTLLKPMQTARRGAGIAYFKGRVYVVGGSDGHQSLTSVEIYDPVTEQWSAGRPLTVPRANLSVTVVGGRLWAVGGFSGKAFLDTMEYLVADDDLGWCAYLPQSGQRGSVVVSNESPVSEKSSQSEVGEVSSSQKSFLELHVNGWNPGQENGCNGLNGHGKVSESSDLSDGSEYNGNGKEMMEIDVLGMESSITEGTSEMMVSSIGSELLVGLESHFKCISDDEDVDSVSTNEDH